jgi:hypothetical protein
VGSDDGRLYAFDAAGTANCSGSPKTCTPLFSADNGTPTGNTLAVHSSPAVAYGMVYIGGRRGTVGYRLP